MSNEPEKKDPDFPLNEPVGTQDILSLADALPGVTWAAEDHGDASAIGLRAQAPFQSKRYQHFLQCIEDPDDPMRITGIARGTQNDDEMLALLAAFPPQFHALRDDIQQKLGLPPITNAHSQAAAERTAVFTQREKQRAEIIEHIGQLPKPAYTTLPLSPDNALKIMQGSAGVTDKDAHFTHLATVDVGPCIAAILKTPERIALVHIDNRRDIYSLGEILATLRASADVPVEVTLWGGRPDKSEPTLADIVTFLEQQPHVRVVAADVLQSTKQRPHGIAVSADGQVMIAASKAIEPCIAPHAAGLHAGTNRPWDPAQLPPLMLAYNGEKREPARGPEQFKKSPPAPGSLKPEDLRNPPQGEGPAAGR